MPRRLPKYCFEERLKGGKFRVRLRRKGYPTITLHGIAWSEPFMAEYGEALKLSPLVTRSNELTWKKLSQRYFAASAQYKQLTQRTRMIRRRILEATFDEPIAPGAEERFGDMPLEAMTAKCVRILHSRLAERPEAANARLKAIRQVISFAVQMEDAPMNFARDVAYFKADANGFYTWAWEDVEQFEERHGAGTKARLALRLLLYAGGPRRQDVVRLGRQHVKNGVLKYRPGKTERRGTVIEVPILPLLADELNHATGRMTFLETAFGKPFTANGFGNWFRRRCLEARLDHHSAHGLRKTGATIAAENGATEAQLMAIFGWSDFKMASHYTRKARRAKLARDAMHLVGAPQSAPQSAPPSKVIDREG